MKYKNQKIKIHGMVFDSKKEAARYEELTRLQEKGVIQDLQRQVKFILIPSQYEKVYSASNHSFAEGKMIERECSYKADFVYKCDGKTIVEDVKGKRTQEYVLKRKLMLYIHGIRITET